MSLLSGMAYCDRTALQHNKAQIAIETELLQALNA